MDFLILNTKIQSGSRQPKIIARPSLVKLLISNSDKNLICLVAGAGYGKTTLVSEFLNASKYNYSWYKIDNSDDNIFLFFTYIIQSIRIKNKIFGKNTLEIINSLRTRTNLGSDLSSVINTIVVTFLNEFNRLIKKSFFIILDDFHLSQKNEWISKSILSLLENTPENLHFVITTREKLPFDTSFLKSKRKYFEVNSEYLKFSKLEVKHFTAEIYDKILNEKEIKILNDKFDGWVTGLHLYFQTEDKSGIENLTSVLPRSLYDFFAGEIFSSKSEPVKNFLVDTCMLENFTPGICNSILNINNSAEILNELLDANVFIKKQIIHHKNKSVECYNYQDLFRDFLSSRFEEIKTGDERKNHYKKIAFYHIQSGDNIGAIKFFLLAGEYDGSLELILSSIASVFDSGNLNLAKNWLAALPEDKKKKNPFVLYYFGCISKYYYGNIREALEYFENALKYLKISDDMFFIKTNIHIAEILIDTGKIEQAKLFLSGLIRKKLNNISKAYFKYWLAVCFYSESDYENSLKLLHQSLDIPDTEELNKLKSEISNLLGNIYLIKGDFIKSLFHYENVINHTKNIYNKFQTLTNIVQLYSHSGQYDKAKKILDKAAGMQMIFPTPFFKLNYILAETHLCYMIGDYEKTIALWNELLVIAQKLNLSYYIYLSYASLGYCYFYLGKFSKTAQYYEMAGRFVNELNETEKTDFAFCKTLLRMETGFSADLENELFKAYLFFDSKGMLYNKVQAAFNIADFHIRKKNYKGGKKYLEECMKIISDNEYISLVQAEIFSKRNVFDFAIENKIHRDFISGVFAGVVTLVNYDWISEECRQRMMSEIDKLYDIKLECFGRIRIMKRGAVIDDDKWIRRIRKLIFAYIMLNHGKNLTKGNIVDLFYPDSTPENADNTFHQLMSNIRSIFKKKEGIKNLEEPVFYITYSGRIIQLNPHYFYFIDALEFEKLYKKSTGYKVSDKDRLKCIKQAIELYKGNFLEGYYQSWCEQERERYRDMHLTLLNEILGIYKEQKDFRNIKYYSEKLLLSDNLNEIAYIDIIETEVKLGNIASAKKKYKLMMKTFKTELGETPSKETMTKIHSVLGL